MVAVMGRLVREERDQSERLVRTGRSPARKVAWARILLKADDGWGFGRIVEALAISAVEARLWRRIEIVPPQLSGSSGKIRFGRVGPSFWFDAKASSGQV